LLIILLNVIVIVTAIAVTIVIVVIVIIVVVITVIGSDFGSGFSIPTGVRTVTVTVFVGVGKLVDVFFCFEIKRFHVNFGFKKDRHVTKNVQIDAQILRELVNKGLVRKVHVVQVNCLCALANRESQTTLSPHFEPYQAPFMLCQDLKDLVMQATHGILSDVASDDDYGLVLAL
jgi:hypothetical protein